MRWEELREEEFEDAIARSGGVCVLPLGCLEKHGQHLPVGTDFLVADGVVNMAAELEEVVVFPTGHWVGVSIHQHRNEHPERDRKRGFIGLNPHTLLTILEELCDEIARNGFRKIVLVNGHGGNTGLLSYFTQAMGYKQRDYAVMVVESIGGSVFQGETVKIHDIYRRIRDHREEFPMITDEDMAVLERYNETGVGGGHADFTETVSVFGLRPELVKPDRFEAESGRSTCRSKHLTEAGLSNQQLLWDANYPNAYSGFAPIGASETIGQARNKILAEHLAKIFRVVKEDEECVRIAQGLPPL